MTSFDNLTDKQFEDIIKKSTTWNEAILNSGLKVRTRTFERKIQNLAIDYTHLPQNYNGLYSKITKFTNIFYKELVEKSKTWDEILIHMDTQSFQLMNNIKKHLTNINISYEHLTSPTTIIYRKQIQLSEILIEKSLFTNMGSLKKKLINELNWKHECSGCHKMTFTNDWVTDVPINLEIDHINGIHDDNRITNLRFLCALCHSYTSTYKGKNMANTKNKIEVKVDIKNTFKCSSCIINNVTEKDSLCVSCIPIIVKPEIKQKKITFINTIPLETIKEDLALLKTYTAVALKYKITPKTLKIYIEKKTNELTILKVHKCSSCNKENVVNEHSFCINCTKEKRTFYLENSPSLKELQNDLETLKFKTEIAKKYFVSIETVNRWFSSKNKVNTKQVCINCKINQVACEGSSCHSCLTKEKFKKAIQGRPSLEQLEKDLIELKSFVNVGKKYDVSDNTIRKWIAKYIQHKSD